MVVMSFRHVVGRFTFFRLQRAKRQRCHGRRRPLGSKVWRHQISRLPQFHSGRWRPRDGRIHLRHVGGGQLVGRFFDAGLLDELIVQVGSVTLGSGRPLLPRQIAFPPLRLISVQQFGSGFAELRYEVPCRA